MKIKNLVLLLFVSLSLSAQDLVISKEKLSFGIGGHEQGLMLNASYTSFNRLGFFIGGAFSNRDEYSLPTPAYFSWVPYNYEAWLTRSAYYGGPVLRISDRFEIGVGYGSKTTRYYKYGYSTVSGSPFRWGTRDETKSGTVIFINAGQSKGFGFHGVGGATGIGVGISLRF